MADQPGSAVEALKASYQQPSPSDAGSEAPGRIERVATELNVLTREEDDALELRWNSLTVTSSRGQTVFLKDILGQVQGRFLAILGPSGSGKTTLLNALACRLEPTIKVRGEALINGVPYDNAVLKRISGYVMQDDLLFENLTVEETLTYTARLRMSANATPEERSRRVEDVLQKLGITECRNTRVGSPLKRGISGGQRKRLCIGMELLTRPRILFLDEPTSGLDSATALSVCTVLKNLTRFDGCSVVCTIHQPQSRIFQLFDDVMIISTGEIVFYGPAEDALAFYEKVGFPCPPLTNPADHLIDVITPSSASERQAALNNARKIKEYYLETRPDLEETPSLEGAEDSVQMTFDPRTPWTTQFRQLLRRCHKENMRARVNVITQIVQSIIIAVLIGTVFFRIDDDQVGVNERKAVLFFCCINQGIFGALLVINSFPSERMIVLRERAAGTYFVSAYFMAKTIADSLLQVVCPVLFSVIVYWLIGLQATAEKFFIFTFFMLLCSFAATSMALLISAACRTTSLAVTVLPMALEVVRLFGGFFMAPAFLPSYFVWLDSLSYVKYAFVGVALNEFTGMTFTCNSNTTCPISNGQQVIEDNGYDKLTMSLCAGALCLMIFGFRLFAYLCIRYIKW